MGDQGELSLEKLRGQHNYLSTMESGSTAQMNELVHLKSVCYSPKWMNSRAPLVINMGCTRGAQVWG